MLSTNAGMVDVKYTPEETETEDIYAGKYDSAYDAFLAERNPLTAEYLDKQGGSFLEVLRMANERPVLFLTLWESLPMYYHAIAVICFKRDDKYNIFIYDPMYYLRPGKKNPEYNYALVCAYLHYYLMGKVHNVSLNQYENN